MAAPGHTISATTNSETARQSILSTATVSDITWDRIHLAIDIEFAAAIGHGGAAQSSQPDMRRLGDGAQADYAAKMRADAEYALARNPDFGNSIDSGGVDLQFALVDRDRSHLVSPETTDGRHYRIAINITNFRNRAFVPNGSWRIFPVMDGVVGNPIAVDFDSMPDFAACSRNFLYNTNRNVFVVSFSLGEDDSHSELVFRTYALSRAGGKKKRTLPRIKFNRYFFSRKTRLKAIHSLYRFFRLVAIKPKPVVLFASEARSRLEGNLLAVYSRMVERELNNELRVTTHTAISGKRSIWQRLQQIRLLAHADIVVLDDYFPTLSSLPVTDTARVIQLWHAGVGFKSVGYSRFGEYGSPRMDNPHRYYTYAIAGSTSLRPVYAENFGIERQSVIATGLPRIDAFMDDNWIAKAKRAFQQQYPTCKGKRIILFAPTFRGRGMLDAHYDLSGFDFQKLYDICGKDKIFAFRMHHFVEDTVSIPPEYSDRLINLSGYEDGLGLLHSVDILITDYSSIFYEFSLLDRPMIFYAPDEKQYAAVRGFHWRFEDVAPGTICRTFADLMATLENEDFDMSSTRRFRQENFDYIDTNASDRVIDWLIKGPIPEDRI